MIWSINTEYDHYQQLIQLMMINKYISKYLALFLR